MGPGLVCLNGAAVGARPVLGMLSRPRQACQVVVSPCQSEPEARAFPGGGHGDGETPPHMMTDDVSIST